MVHPLIWILGFFFLSSVSSAIVDIDGECAEETAQRSIAHFRKNLLDTEGPLAKKFFSNGQWRIPASEIPFTVESLKQGTLLLRPYFTHASPVKEDCWIGGMSRGYLDTRKGLANINTKSHRQKIRNLMESQGLVVRLDHRFDDVLRACATTPHQAPLWKKNEVTGAMQPDGFLQVDKPGDPTHRRTIFTTSTWISPAVQKVWKEAHREGLLHSLGVFTREGELVAGSMLIVFEGNLLSLSAFTASRITHRLEGLHVLTEPLLSDSGHVEFASTLLFALNRGFRYLDVGMIIPGVGAGANNVGGESVHVEEFMGMLGVAKMLGATFPEAPPGSAGIDITPLVREFVARKDDGKH